jgi:hypothetical protein
VTRQPDDDPALPGEELRHALGRLQGPAAIGTLMALFAHGANNRLTVILSCLDVLDHAGLSDPDLRDAVQLARAASGDLCNDLAALQASARRSPPQSTSSSLHDLVRAARRLAQWLANRRFVVVAEVPASLYVETGPGACELAICRLLLLAQRRGAQAVVVRGSEVEVVARAPERPDLRAGRYCRIDVECPGAELSPVLLRTTGGPGRILERLQDADGLDFAAVEAFAMSLRGCLIAMADGIATPRFELYLPNANDARLNPGTV